MNGPRLDDRISVIALAVVFIGLTCVRDSRAQDAETRHARVLEHLKRRAAEISSDCLSDIETLDDWKRERPRLKRELVDMLGLEPMPPRTPLKPEVTGTLKRPGYTIEKIVFQSMPGLYVTGNFYLPEKVDGPLPTILYLCGHSPGPHGAKVSYQDRAVWFVQHGYSCLVLDTLEFGEVAGIHHGVHDLNMWYWISLGYTPAGTEVWNGIRALDYLSTRREVDMQSIGVTGISGGGAITWFLAAVDDRVAVAAPICSTYTIGSQAKDWVAAGQCDCIYVHNMFSQDFPVVAALIAPRPLLICSGQRDGIFPPDGYHAVFQQAKRIYDLHGAADEAPRIKEVDDDVPHTDAPLFRQQTRQWMNRWLKNDLTPLEIVPNPEAGPEPGEVLACLKDLPPDAINYRIHRQFAPVADLTASDNLQAWEARRKNLLDDLQTRVFRWFPGNDIPFDSKVLRTRRGWVNRYANYREVEFNSEHDVRVLAQFITRKDASKDAPLLIYAKRAGDSIYAMDLDELLPVLGRSNVLILHPRLTEHPMTSFEYAEVERTATWTGRTVAAMQVWDILRSVEWAIREQGLTPSSVSVFGKGEMGVNGLYAALLDDRVTQVILDAPPGSHWQGPALMNVLRYTDVAEAAAMLAPRRLSSLTRLPVEFELTKNTYRLHDRADQLRESTSLPASLEL